MASTFGITLVAGGSTIVESVDVDSKVDVKILKASDGTFSAAQSIAPEFSFSVRGKGTCPVSVGGSTGAPSNVSGKIIITSTKVTQTNEDWDAFEYSGSAYPNAT